MNLYGPSAATGIGGYAIFSVTNSFWLALAMFTLIGAGFALLRILPRIRLNR